jgi:hypothetical protein
MISKDLNLKDIPCFSLPSSSAVWRSAKLKLKKTPSGSTGRIFFELTPETEKQPFRTNTGSQYFSPRLPW